MNNLFFYNGMRKVIMLSASFLLVLSACKKEGELTPEFAENTSISVFTDSIKLTTRTRRGDSVLADQVSTGLLGSYKDSSFGKSVSTIYMQPLLPSNSLVFGGVNDQLIVDSVVLSLVYNNWFGDTTIAQTFDVFRLDEVLDDEEQYYSNTSVNVIPGVLGSITALPRPLTDQIVNIPNATGGVDTTSLSPQLRIRLDDALGTEILSKSGQAEVSDNENFTSFFKGLKITPNEAGALNDNEKAILYFGLTSSQTKMTVFYTSVSTQNDTLKKSVDFPVNSSSVRFNTFEYDYSGSAVESSLNNPNDDSVYSYTQAMAGVETVIKFDDLKAQFKDKNIVINKAELVLPVASGSYANFGVAQSLILASRDASDKLQFIDDYFESQSYFGGEYDEVNREYRFNIARYIQNYLNGLENNNGLTLLVTGSAVKAERAVIYTQGNSGRKISLNLYYSNTQ